MNTNVDKLVKELEDIYVNSCLKEAIDAGNEKCLALDEQELAIMYMCVEGIEREEGINKDNYIARGLFILLKDRELGESACNRSRVAAEPLKYKRIQYNGGYVLEHMTQLLLVYYATLLLYANNANTGDYYMQSKRHYFKVYAYFACICPKTFTILFFNQIHLFISIKYKQMSAKELKEYLDYTDELWKEYNLLLSNEIRIEITEEVITRFSEIMSYDEAVFYENRIQLDKLSEDGFLAFNFKEEDTLREYRFKMLLTGIEYFHWYLKYLKSEMSGHSFKEEGLIGTIDSIIESTEALGKIFESFLKKEDGQPDLFVREFDNMYELKHKFYKYCEGKVTLIDA